VIRMNILREQKGFTLIELLMVVSLTGIIGGVAAMTTTTMMKLVPQSNDHVVAQHQVQNAGFWITRDVQMAQTIDSDPVGGELIQMTLNVVGSPDVIVTYELEDMDSGMKRLVRRTDQGTEMLVAEYIYYDPDGDPDNTTNIVDYQSSILTFRITAKSGNVSVIKKYEATQRVPTT
jgi:prepilin-type N-terminal cleavage/methylation domain-containing protein